MDSINIVPAFQHKYDDSEPSLHGPLCNEWQIEIAN